jgi:hypothetical protein
MASSTHLKAPCTVFVCPFAILTFPERVAAVSSPGQQEEVAEEIALKYQWTEPVYS